MSKVPETIPKTKVVSEEAKSDHQRKQEKPSSNAIIRPIEILPAQAAQQDFVTKLRELNTMPFGNQIETLKEYIYAFYLNLGQFHKLLD